MTLGELMGDILLRNLFPHAIPAQPTEYALRLLIPTNSVSSATRVLTRARDWLIEANRTGQLAGVELDCFDSPLTVRFYLQDRDTAILLRLALDVNDAGITPF